MSDNYTPRVYVACLASYNDGILHGAWVDAVDADEIQEGIDRVLFTSPRPNVTRCKTCKQTLQHNGTWGRVCDSTDGAHDPAPSAEEHAFHDYDGFGAAAPGEYASVSEVAEIGAFIAEHGAIGVALLSHVCVCRDLDRARELMSDGYRGAWHSLEEYAENFLEDTGAFQGASDTLRNYFDFEKFARDLEIGGDVFTIETDDGMTHVFDGTI